MHNLKLQMLNLILPSQKFSFFRIKYWLNKPLSPWFFEHVYSFWLCLFIIKIHSQKEDFTCKNNIFFQLKQTRYLSYRNKNITNAQVDRGWFVVPVCYNSETSLEPSQASTMGFFSENS